MKSNTYFAFGIHGNSPIQRFGHQTERVHFQPLFIANPMSTPTGALAHLERFGEPSRERQIVQIWLRHLIRPNAKTLKGIGAERRCHGDIRRVPSSRQEDSTDAGRIVPRIEHMPFATEIRLEPGREIARRMRSPRALVGEISRAVARGNVQRPAERNGQVRVVAAHPTALVIGFQGGPGDARVLIAKRNVLMREITNRLDAFPPRLGRFE